MNKQELIEKLKQNHAAFIVFVSDLNERDFTFAPDGKWTAGQQLDHIVRGVSPLKKALSLPNFVPKLLFGKADRASMSYDDLVKTYQAKLVEGGRATGRFIPEEIGFGEREALIAKLEDLVEGLCRNVEGFSEKQLDEFVLPHPLIGKLTLREMLYFTIYHVIHHQKHALENLGK